MGSTGRNGWIGYLRECSEGTEKGQKTKGAESAGESDEKSPRERDATADVARNFKRIDPTGYNTKKKRKRTDRKGKR